MRGGLLIASVFLVSGCVTRTLRVTTEPAGAEVWINDAPVGTSPVAVRFHYYGTYRIAARKAGFAHAERTEDLIAPWYAWTPFDFFSEVVFPGEIQDRREVKITLEKLDAKAPDAETMVGRLREARKRYGPRLAPRPDAKPPADESGTGRPPRIPEPPDLEGLP